MWDHRSRWLFALVTVVFLAMCIVEVSASRALRPSAVRLYEKMQKDLDLPPHLQAVRHPFLIILFYLYATLVKKKDFAVNNF